MVQSDAEVVEARCDHLTPLEIITKVAFEYGGHSQKWDDQSTDSQSGYVAEMRAALLALAEADFHVPEHTVPEMEEIDGEARPCELKVSPWTSIYVFRSMLREIAGESK